MKYKLPLPYKLPWVLTMQYWVYSLGQTGQYLPTGPVPIDSCSNTCPSGQESWGIGIELYLIIVKFQSLHERNCPVLFRCHLLQKFFEHHHIMMKFPRDSMPVACFHLFTWFGWCTQSVQLWEESTPCWDGLANENSTVQVLSQCLLQSQIPNACMPI